MSPSTIEGAYPLPHDERETRRLDLQQSIVARVVPSYPFLLPSLPPLANGSKVLDCGTGTGAWLRALPSVLKLEGYGIDISSQKFPSPLSIPQHLHFIEGSVLRLPEEWTATFSLVNQIFLMTAIRTLPTNEWLVLLKEFHRVLQPDGWITLGEAGRRIAVGPKTEILEEIMSTFFKVNGCDRDVALSLPQFILTLDDMFDRESIVTQTYRIPFCGSSTSYDKGVARDAIRSYITGFHTLKETLFARAREEMKQWCESEEAFAKFLDELEEEWNESKEGYMEFIVVAAKKK